MKKLFALAVSALLLSSSPVWAENWLPFQDSGNTFVDTDSFVDSGIRSSIAVKSPLDGGSAISTIEFDKEKRSYRISEMKTFDKDGNQLKDFTYSDDPQNWSRLVSHSFGMNLYDHYISHPLPRFNQPVWLIIHKEEGVRFHGSTYDVEKNTISYKDGYATFWVRISYPWKDQDFSKVVYQVKMDMPHKKIQTLSMTSYDFEGKVKAHGAGSRDREDIVSGSPMEKVYEYINKELNSGHIRMLSSL